MNMVELYKLIIFNYYILFKIEHFEKDYKPIVQKDAYSASQTTHLWDKELDAIIPALWYVLHLPRMGFDVIENNINLVLHSHDEPHNIYPFSYSIDYKEEQISINKKIFNPTIIICPDEIYEDVKSDKTIPESLLGIWKISDLSNQLLLTQWKQLSYFIQKHVKDSKECIVDSNFKLTTNDERKILPLIPFANQLGYTHQLIDDIENLNSENNNNKFVLEMRKIIIDTYRAISKEDQCFKERTEKNLIENPNFNGIPLVITMPGIMKYQVKKVNRRNELPNDEKDVINILGFHRAIAKNALYIDIDSFSQEMFTELANLEEHCKDANKVNNTYVWRILIKKGKWNVSPGGI